MKVNIAKRKKIIKLITISWLITRLKLTIEISRLAIFRMLPKMRVNYIAYVSSMPTPALWTFENETVSFINFDRSQNAVNIHKFPALSKN